MRRTVTAACEQVSNLIIGQKMELTKIGLRRNKERSARFARPIFFRACRLASLAEFFFRSRRKPVHRPQRLVKDFINMKPSET